MSALRAGMGERAGDVVGDMTQVGEEKERMNPTGGGRGYMFPAPRRSPRLKVISWSSRPLRFRLQVNATGKLGSFLLRRRTY